MRFNISYQSVVLIIVSDIDTAIQKVVDMMFDPVEASMPIVLNVERLDDEDEEENGDAA